MAMRASRSESSRPVAPLFFVDRRDRRPGTHFAAELGRTAPVGCPAPEDHVDEDLGESAFGIDLPFLRRD